jgi:hypothetical protein
MNPEVRTPRAVQLAHERARMLAAESVDVALEPGDAEWLDGHLGTCPECSAVADEYRAIHLELRSLPLPQPPRDLWARISVGLDGVDAAAPRGSRPRRTAWPSRRPLFTTASAVGFVVVVAIASLLVQSPILGPAPTSGGGSPFSPGIAAVGQPSGAPQAQLGVVNGTSYWIASGSGVYAIQGGTAQCSTADGSCAVASGTSQTLGLITSDTSVSAVIGPNASQAAVWTSDKVVILPLSTTPQAVTLDQLTPRPTVAATATATPTTNASVATSVATPAQSTPTVTPVESATATAPGATAVAPSPAPTVATTTAPVASGSAPASTSGPLAILSGYEIVGRDPAFSADGSEVAFSARPADHSAGPDVFVWSNGHDAATPVTSNHAAMFAGWLGSKILISEISTAPAAFTATASPAASAAAASPAGQGSGTYGATSYVFDPASGSYSQIDRPMLFPTVDPTGQFLVYWAGSVEFDPVTGLWQPGNGDLYFDRWSDLRLIPVSPEPGATPSGLATPTAAPTPTPAVDTGQPPTLAPTEASPTPPLPPSPADTSSPSAGPTASPAPAALPTLLQVAPAPAQVHDWVVRWDRSGRHVAVWVADPGSDKIGRLSLFSVDSTSDTIDTNEPLLAASEVLTGVTFDDGHLIYTSAVDGKTYMQAVPAVPPSTVSTPSATTPGQQAPGAAASAPAAPQSSGRPGN